MSDFPKTHNRPPVTLTDAEAKLVLQIVSRDMGQALQLLMLPNVSRERLEALVALTERMKPLRAKLIEAGIEE